MPTVRRAVVLLASLLVLSSGAQAQIFRAYVSLNGSDANPCTLVAPCRLLPAALAVVADGGEVWMLDTANYNTGMVTISKSVSILAVPGAVGSVVATAGGDVLRIDGLSARVALRNVVIARMAGMSAAVNGINVFNALSLVVDGCTFSGVTNGILTSGDSLTQVQVTDSHFRDHVTGIRAQSGPNLSVARSTFTNMSAGVRVNATGGGDATGAVTESVFLNVNTGVMAVATIPGESAVVNVSRSQFHVGATAMTAQGAAGANAHLGALGNAIAKMSSAGISTTGGKIVASGNLVTGSAVGLLNTSGTFETRGDNAVSNNTTNLSGTITKLPGD